MYGMDPALCLNLQGQQLKGNEWRTFRKEPEVFEVYYVDMDDEQGTRGHDILVARQIGGRACGWTAGKQVQRGGTTVTIPPDRVSIGLADRTAAETGGKYFGSNNVGGFTLADADKRGPNSILPTSTDRLSASSAYPESTYLVEDIEKPRRIPLNWDHVKDFSGGAKFTHTVDDPTEEGQGATRTLTSDIPTMEVSRRVDSIIPTDVMKDVDASTGYGKPKDDGTANYPQWVEIKVKDATKLTSHNRALDRHLYRGTREPWPYGDAPWPVPHQSEFHVPQKNVYEISANFPGPMNNLFRVGKKPSKGLMPFEEYFIADEPLLNPVAGDREDGRFRGFFELVDALDALDGASSGIGGGHMNRVIEVNKVKYDYDFPIIGKKSVEHIEVHTEFKHDLKNGEKIWLDEIQATQGACRIEKGVCLDGEDDITGTYDTRKKCEACIMSNGDDVTDVWPTRELCEAGNAVPGIQQSWIGDWHSGMIKKRKLTPDMTVGVDQDYCENPLFGICKTKVGPLGKEIRLNPDGVNDTIGITNDGKGKETNAIMDKAVCLAVTKDQDGVGLTPIWTGPGAWVDTEVPVKGCVDQGEPGDAGSAAGNTQFDFEDIATDPCDKCYVKCRMNNMFWNGDGSCGPKKCCGRDDYCLSAEANGEWIVSNVTDTTFTIHQENYIDAEPNDALDATGAVSLEYDPTQLHTSFDTLTTKQGADGWNKIVPGHPMGHEVGIGPPAGPFGEFYENRYVDVKAGIREWQGVWTRHGGLFRVVVGSHEGTPYPGMDCNQANTTGVDLDFQFIEIPEGCCNIHTPVGDSSCQSRGYPGYGPSSARSEKLNGVAFIANVTDKVSK